MTSPAPTRAQWLTLAAMTLALSMILVDQTAVPLAIPQAIDDLDGSLNSSTWILTANVLPLAAFTLLGGRLGDLFGLRCVFLIGAAVFLVATVLTGAALDMPWIIATRALQGCGAALMLPTAVAIVSATFPPSRRGTALGILAGGSAAFAAAGPVLGGLLTALDWRLVFFVNVPLAAAAIAITLVVTPRLEPDADADRSIDWPGVATFALAAAAIVFGLNQGQAVGWLTAQALGALVAGAAALALFAVVELRTSAPLLNLRLFRHGGFLAANVGQFLAGMVELGLGFLMPYYLLLVVGVDPLVAGLALIPGTIPVLLAGPYGGRWFDRVGGRTPLAVGFLVLAASGVVLALSVSAESALALVPGLLLQGAGLGIVLTVNDPTGLTAVPESDRGQAAGMLNTAEQLGGAVGIAGLSAIELARNFASIDAQMAAAGIDPTDEQVEAARQLVQRAEEIGLDRATDEAAGRFARFVSDAIVQAHVDAFELTLLVCAGLALAGAIACWLLLRPAAPEPPMHATTRRVRYRYLGRTPQREGRGR